MNEQELFEKLLKHPSAIDKGSINQLIELSYPTLIKIAQGIRRQSFQVSATLDTVALVNESWLKINQHGLKAENEKHYYCLMAKVMRQLLLNNARKFEAQKRQLPPKDSSSNKPAFEINETLDWQLELDRISQALETEHPRMAEVFMLRYYLGMTNPEVSQILHVSERTVRRDWLLAKKIVRELMNCN